MEHSDCKETTIEGMTFLVCTQEVCDEVTGEPTGQWHAWSFFAYNRSLTIYPADAVPSGIAAQESIAGEFGATAEEAQLAVEERLRTVIRTKKLDGTGFYSPPGDFIYPQELPPPTD